MFINTPIFTPNSEYDNLFIENEDVITSDQTIFVFENELVINNEFTILGEMIILEKSKSNLLKTPFNLKYSNIITYLNIFLNISPNINNPDNLLLNYSISPSLPNGLSLNSTTGIITGIPTNIQSLTNYTITATSFTGSTSANFYIIINAAIVTPSGLSYNNIVENKNSNISYSPTLSAGDGNLIYSILPSLPEGLSINSTTGVISGIPVISQILTNYIVTVSNFSGSTNANLSITINAAPLGLTYYNIVINQNSFTSYGPYLSDGTSPITYSISPSLPTGLSINSSTGVISGTPTVFQSLTNYIVTATNSIGSTTATVPITINEVIAPSGLSYNSGQSATPLTSTSLSYTPTLSAGTSPTYSISPPLPEGLSINSFTGIISGTSSLSNDNTYTITATNTAGTTSASFRIRIVYVNTTMTVNYLYQYLDRVNNGVSEYAIIDCLGFGEFKPQQYPTVTVGSLASRSIRGQIITRMYYMPSINYTIFEMTGTIPNTNEGAFTKITWNNKVINRTDINAFSQSVDGFGRNVTSWNGVVSGAAPVTNSGLPYNVSLIIE